MDKTKLIDAEEAAEAVESLYQIIQRGDLTSSDMDEAETAYVRFIKLCMSPPVPTIKPGDKVRIRDAMDPKYIGKESIVTKVSQTIPLSAQLKDLLGWWTFSSLEVVE